jgi:hypothetical protein
VQIAGFIHLMVGSRRIDRGTSGTLAAQACPERPLLSTINEKVKLSSIQKVLPIVGWIIYP